MGSLSLRNVTKAYGAAEVLKGIHLDIEAGEFLILVGPSGCGKSTLLNVIAGLDSVTSGDIYIGDRRINDLSPKDRDIAMVFQSYALYPNMTVRRNISFGLEMRKVPAAEQARIVDDVARILQMGHLLDRKPAQLSGGQRQRVAMGRAIARNPALFLFDEPLSNLDAKLRVEMRTEIKLLHQRVGKTIVYVTHDQIEAMTLGDRIAVMNAGEVQQFGTPHEVYENPVNRFVAGFMGSPAMNFVHVAVVEAGSGVGVQLEIDGKAHLVPVPSAALRNRQGKQAIMGIRPENVTHKDDLRPSDHDRYVFAAQVEVTEPTGPDTLVMVRINGGETVCRIHPSHAKPRGQTIELAFDMSKAMFFDADTGSRIA